MFIRSARCSGVLCPFYLYCKPWNANCVGIFFVCRCIACAARNGILLKFQIALFPSCCRRGICQPAVLNKFPRSLRKGNAKRRYRQIPFQQRPPLRCQGPHHVLLPFLASMMPCCTAEWIPAVDAGFFHHGFQNKIFPAKCKPAIDKQKTC